MAWGGIRMVSENFKKIFLTFLGLGINVVKVGSVNSELLFQWDTLIHTCVCTYKKVCCAIVLGLESIHKGFLYTYT